LWLEIFHEFDAPGLANPCGINMGNVDVAVQAFRHIAQFFHARLPFVMICGGRISASFTEYQLASGAGSGKTYLDILFETWEAQGSPGVDIDFLYQNMYDSKTFDFHLGRADECHDYCNQYNIMFGQSEVGLMWDPPINGGQDNNPAFIDFWADMANNTTRYPHWHHGNYFEGLPFSGMLAHSGSTQWPDPHPEATTSIARLKARAGVNS
jgi:hypothetical protein